MLKKTYRGAVFFDADGTLIDTPAGITEPTLKTKECLKALKSEGWLVAIATGRSRCYPPRGCENLFDCWITSNGAAGILDGEKLFQRYIPEETVKRAVEIMDKLNINYVLEGQESCFVKDISQAGFLKMMGNYSFSLENFTELENSRREVALSLPWNKLMAAWDVGRNEVFAELKEALGKDLDITLQPGNPSADVCLKGISKGTAVKTVLEMLSIEKSQAYAFGDADNDITMMEAVGTGVAMGRHTENLRRVTRFVTGTPAEEGIAHGLEELGLINISGKTY